MQRTGTKNMPADICTKAFVNSDEWKHVRGLFATARTLDETFQIVNSLGGPSGLAPTHVAPDRSSTQTEMKLESAHNEIMRNLAALGAAAPRAKDSEIDQHSLPICPPSGVACPGTPPVGERQSDRTLIETCCPTHSVLGRAVAEAHGCETVRLTALDDFGTEAGLRKWLTSIRGGSQTPLLGLDPLYRRLGATVREPASPGVSTTTCGALQSVPETLAACRYPDG